MKRGTLAPPPPAIFEGSQYCISYRTAPPADSVQQSSSYIGSTFQFYSRKVSKPKLIAVKDCRCNNTSHTADNFIGWPNIDYRSVLRPLKFFRNHACAATSPPPSNRFIANDLTIFFFFFLQTQNTVMYMITLTLHTQYAIVVL